MANIEAMVEKLIENTIEELGYILYDVEYAKEGKDYFLRIYIDNINGITLDDCEKVNNSIIDILDEADYIKTQYFLEVSSSGVEKVLRKDKQLQNHIGELIQLKLFIGINGEKQLIGFLKNFDDKNIVINQEDNENIENLIEIPRKNISLIKTVYEW